MNMEEDDGQYGRRGWEIWKKRMGGMKGDGEEYGRRGWGIWIKSLVRMKTEMGNMAGNIEEDDERI